MIPFKLYAIAGGALVLIALFGTIYVQHLKIEAADAQADAAVLARDTAIAANSDLADTVKRLEAVNLELSQGRAIDKAAADKAIAELQTQREALQQAVDASRRNRSIIYAQDQSAATWAAARVPDAIADSLRAGNR